MLALADGPDIVYPAFQFKGNTVLNGFPEVLQALAMETNSDITALSFLLSPNRDFDNRTAIEMLRAGEIKTVVSEARVFLKQGA